MKNGEVLGADERISVLDALEAITKNAAYQYFEEDIKGTIKEGKLADLVILDKNPLKVDVDDIQPILSGLGVYFPEEELQEMLSSVSVDSKYFLF